MERLKRTTLIQRIVVGAGIGATLAILFPTLSAFGWLGTLFVSALKGVAPFLVFILTLSSVAQHRPTSKSYVGKIVKIYLFATFLASLVAVFASELFPLKIHLQEAVTQNAPTNLSDVLENILKEIVENPIEALIQGDYLSVLFWASLLGIALRKSNEHFKENLQTLAEGVTQMVQLVIQFAPIGICGLVYQSISSSGVGGLIEYGSLLLLLISCMLFTALVVYPLVVFALTRQNPYPLVMFCLKESAIPAFFTRSSAANIPINMKLAKQLKLEEESYSISLPLGATINMGGAAITISILTLATVATIGLEVPLVVKFVLCLISTLSACGASGIAGGSLLLVPLACSLFGISNDIAMQVVGVGFVIGVIQDSFETALNSSSDLLFTATAEFAEQRKEKSINIKERLYTYKVEEV